MYNLSLYMVFVLLFSAVLTVQGCLSLYQLLFGWLHPENMEKNRVREVRDPHTTFSIIIPCRHEEKVIGETLAGILAFDYPESLVEIIVSVGLDDSATIAAIKKVQEKYPKRDIRIVAFDPSTTPRKSLHLNEALKSAKGIYTAVFDAEDDVHSQLLLYVNTIIVSEGDPIIQTGVSLTNWKSNWYGLHAVMEYYFWFHSRLQWYASQGVVPLGGVGIFVPTNVLMAVNGWDENSLTEDAKLGFDLAKRGHTFRILSNEDIATREEIPGKLISFIRQRTRWIQGFLQIAFSGNWSNLSFSKQLIFLTLFAFPLMQILFYGWFVVSFFYATKLPILIVLFSFLPLALLFFQLVIQLAGVIQMLVERKQIKHIPFAIGMYILSYPFYQVILVVATIRALFRNILGANNWEKTHHGNLHREGVVAV